MKRTLAMVLAAMLSFSVVASATEMTDWGESGEAGGSGSVNNPIISYVVPGGASGLDFALDPFAMADGSTSQVFSANFPVTNKSNVGIKVDIKGYVVPGADVTVKPSVGDVTTDDPTKDMKELYMELVALPVTNASLNGPIDSGDLTYNQTGSATGSATAAKAVLAAKPADSVKPLLMTMALKKATYSSTTLQSLDKDSVGVFRFAGTVNPNATWVADTDVQVKAVYDVRGLNDAAYAAMLPSSLDAELKAAHVASVGGSGGGSSSSPTPSITTSGSLTLSSGDDLTFEISLGSGDTAATGITSIKAGTTALTKTTHWTLSGTTVTIKTGSVAALVNAVKGKDITVTFNDTAKTVETISVNA